MASPPDGGQSIRHLAHARAARYRSERRTVVRKSAHDVRESERRRAEEARHDVEPSAAIANSTGPPILCTDAHSDKVAAVEMAGASKKTILLVEDEAIIAMSTKLALERCGYAVMTVCNGETAVREASGNPAIDLILMDINLGSGIDGTQAAALILRDHDVPIVFLSSHTEPEVVEKTEKITSYGYVVKNSSATVLDASIKMAFKLFDAKLAALKKERLIFEHEEKYRLLHENAGVGIGYYSLDGRSLSFNQRAAKYLAGVPEDLIGKSIDELFPEAEAKSYRERIRRAASSDSPLMFEDLVSLPGGRHYFINTYTRIADMGGNLLGVQVISQDITRNKLVEEELRASKETAEMLLGISAEIIISEDFEGNILLLNESGHRLLGYEPPELIGRNFFDVCLPDDARSEVRGYFMSLRNGDLDAIVSHENEVITSSGERKTIYWRNALLRDGNGTPVGVFSSGQDMTARKDAEVLLRMSEARLAQAETIAGIGNWILHLDTRIMDSSHGADVIYGVDFASTSLEAVQKIPLPECRPVLDRALSDLITRGAPYDCEFKIRRQTDGAIRHIHSAATFDEKAHTVFGVIQDVTERVRSEELLRTSEELHRTILQTIMDGYLLSDEHGMILDANESYCRMSGYERHELQAMHIDVLVADESPDEIAGRVRRIMANGTERFESCHRRRDGSLMELEVSVQYLPLEGGRIVSFFRDITEQKAMARALRSSEEHHRRLIENSHDIIYTMTSEGVFTFVSPAWTHLLGHPVDEVIGKTLEQFVKPEDVPGCRAWLRELMRTGERRHGIEYRVRHQDGSYRWHTTSAVPFRDEAGTVVGFEGTASDITEHRLSEERIRSLLSEKELILKEVHHRIKNNMHTVSSLLSLQAASLKDPAAILAVRDAESRVTSMTLLYDKLYRTEDFARLSVKDYLSALVDEVVANFAWGQNIQVRKDLHDFPLDAALVPPLGIAINELLTNAMKYAFAGRQHGLLVVSATRMEGTCTITVEDDGVGMPDSVSFEHSSGFGLQLVHALAEQLHGTIRMERIRGTRFIVEFKNELC